jgi:hypothetical protein
MASDRGFDAGRANAYHGAEDQPPPAAATVLCPKGHANAWNYKFRGECRSPIGLLPWPSDDSPSAGLRVVEVVEVAFEPDDELGLREGAIGQVAFHQCRVQAEVGRGEQADGAGALHVAVELKQLGG